MVRYLTDGDHQAAGAFPFTTDGKDVILPGRLGDREFSTC